MSQFSLKDDLIVVSELQAQLIDPDCGACATFEGWVRNHNEGCAVSQLEYQAYETLALKEGQVVIAEALKKFEIRHAICQHRVGLLNVSDLAVWVGVSAPHRDAAFSACRYIIDEIKHRLPVWKKEYYVDGTTEWVNCAACAATSEQPL